MALRGGVAPSSQPLTPVSVRDAERPVRSLVDLLPPRERLLRASLGGAHVTRLILLDDERRRAAATLGEVALLNGLEKLRLQVLTT